MPRKSDVAEFNLNKLKSLNCLVARIDVIHTGGSEARKADADTAKGLENKLLLARAKGCKSYAQGIHETEIENSGSK